VPAMLLNVSELTAQVVEVLAINEALALQEVDEHQPIEHHRGVPGAIALVADTVDRLDQPLALDLVLLIEGPCHALHVEGVSQPAGDFDDRQLALLVQLADIDEQAANLAQEEIPRLTLDVEVLARRDAPIFTLAPVPERARLLGVGENQQILVILLRNLTPDRTA